MKKLFALFLALTMVFALAACGGSEKPPANSGDNQLLDDLQDAVGGKDGGDQPDASQGDDSDKGGGLSWPSTDFITPGMEYTGSGEINFVQKGKTAALGGGDVMLDSAHVYINGGDWDSIKAYVDALKADGFSWYNANNEAEPAYEFNEYGFYRWEGEADGGSRFILLNFYEEDKDPDNDPYNLEILMLNGNMHAK